MVQGARSESSGRRLESPFGLGSFDMVDLGVRLPLNTVWSEPMAPGHRGSPLCEIEWKRVVADYAPT